MIAPSGKQITVDATDRLDAGPLHSCWRPSRQAGPSCCVPIAGAGAGFGGDERAPSPQRVITWRRGAARPSRPVAIGIRKRRSSDSGGACAWQSIKSLVSVPFICFSDEAAYGSPRLTAAERIGLRSQPRRGRQNKSPSLKMLRPSHGGQGEFPLLRTSRLAFPTHRLAGVKAQQHLGRNLNAGSSASNWGHDGGNEPSGHSPACLIC